jgi:phosphoglycolate phosphatase-like HAD superfamily hydrolase
MHAIIFDVDGTLIKSTHVDGMFFKQSVVEEIGQVTFRKDMSKYIHVTDQGCLMEVFQDNLITHTPVMIQGIKQKFFKKIREYIAANNGFAEIPGAKDFLHQIVSHPFLKIAFATGGWYESAKTKLESAGFDLEGIPLITSDDIPTRTGIMKKALDSLGNSFVSVTYYGDATWDRKATAELGWNFQPVGTRLKGLNNYHQEADRLLKQLFFDRHGFRTPS